jgi:hypothetical protein
MISIWTTPKLKLGQWSRKQANGAPKNTNAPNSGHEHRDPEPPMHGNF